MKYLNYLVLLTIISCGSGEVRQNIEENSYRTSGVEQFFLPEVPAWANFSARGACFKNRSFQYLDFSKLSVSYQLSYPEMVELQAQYNDRLESYFRSTTVRFLKPVEEASFFSNTLEQVRGGIRHLRIPNVPQVEVIMLDAYMLEKKTADIIKMAKAGRFDERLPILFSSCYSKQGLSQWLSEQNLDQVGFHIVSAEWLNPFGSDLTAKPGLQLELKKLLPTGTKVLFLSPLPIVQPPELITE